LASKHLMIAINWYGPYETLEEAQVEARDWYAHGLYLAIGKRKFERRAKMQYIGIGEALHRRLHDGHHKLGEITRDRVFWLGEIATAEPSGRRVKVTRASLDYAEWLHVRFLGLPLNDKKTKSLPKRGVTVLNRWFETNFKTAHKRAGHLDWPDLIDFPDPVDELPARTVWFRSRRKEKFEPSDYAKAG